MICIGMPEHTNAGLEGQVFYNIHDKEKPYPEQVIDVYSFTCPSICKLWELIHNTKKEIKGEIIRTQITQFFSLVSLKGKNKETRRHEKFISSSKCKGNRELETSM